MLTKEKEIETKDINLIAYLMYKEHNPSCMPKIDSYGTKWVYFKNNEKIKKDWMSFLGGNNETRLLECFKKARSFLLDLPCETKEEG